MPQPIKERAKLVSLPVDLTIFAYRKSHQYINVFMLTDNDNHNPSAEIHTCPSSVLYRKVTDNLKSQRLLVILRKSRFCPLAKATKSLLNLVRISGISRNYSKILIWMIWNQNATGSIASMELDTAHSPIGFSRRTTNHENELYL